jgi:hypothetical protein
MDLARILFILILLLSTKFIAPLIMHRNSRQEEMYETNKELYFGFQGSP